MFQLPSSSDCAIESVYDPRMITDQQSQWSIRVNHRAAGEVSFDRITIEKA